MTLRLRLGLTILFASLFTLLFFEQEDGLNFLLLHCLIIVSAWLVTPRGVRSVLFYICTSGVALTGIAYVYHHGDYAYWIGLLSRLSLAGVVIYPEVKSIQGSLRMAFVNLLLAPKHLIGTAARQLGERPRLVLAMRKWYISLAPLVIIVVFTSLYSASNTLFSRALQKASTLVGDAFDRFFTLLDIRVLVLFVCGSVLASLYYFGIVSKKAKHAEEELSDQLSRHRNRKGLRRLRFNSLALLDEYKGAIFLLATLNLLLFALNLMDLKLIWWGFEWTGEYLKPMLHQGTYLLILSILISIGITLFYFRGNLNFYKKNNTLKMLSYAWLVQNAFLCLSVLMRTYHYIQHFNLAHRRIGVIFFVTLCILGLYFVYRKIADRRSSYYLLKRMSLTCLVALVLAALPDWNRIIAKYNFSHGDSAFIHLDYLSGLSNGTLDVLDVPLEQLNELRQNQEEQFSGSSIGRSLENNYYMDAETFRDKIDSRIYWLQQRYPKMSWLEWNYADYRAYQALKDRQVSPPRYRSATGVDESILYLAAQQSNLHL